MPLRRYRSRPRTSRRRLYAKRSSGSRRYGRRSARARTSFRRRPSRFIRRTAVTRRRIGTGRRVTMRYKKDASQFGHLSLKYRSRRRFPRMSRRFIKSVRDAAVPTQIFKTDTNFNLTYDMNKSGITVSQVGGAASYTFSIFQQAWNNTQFYEKTDPGAATITDPKSRFFKVHILQWKETWGLTNITNHKCNITVYEVIPRVSIPYGSNLTPLDCIANPDYAALIYNVGMPQDDYRYTPFQSARFVHYYKVLSVKRFTLEPGAETYVSCVMNNFNLSNDLDGSITGTPIYSARTGVTKFYMFKASGCEATNQAGARETAAGMIRIRNLVNIHFKSVIANRPIVQYNTHPDITNTDDKIINPVKGEIESATALI